MTLHWTQKNSSHCQGRSFWTHWYRQGNCKCAILIIETYLTFWPKKILEKKVDVMNEEHSSAAEIALTRSDSYWERHRQSKKYSPDQRPLVARIKTKGKIVGSAQSTEPSLGFQIQGVDDSPSLLSSEPSNSVGYLVPL